MPWGNWKKRLADYNERPVTPSGTGPKSEFEPNGRRTRPTKKRHEFRKRREGDTSPGGFGRVRLAPLSVLDRIDSIDKPEGGRKS